MLSSIQFSSIFLALLLDPVSAGTIHQKSHQERANICGTKGYDRGEGNYYYDDSSKYNTYAACSAKCAADTACKSFGYGAKECMLFSIALSGNFDADSSSSDTYYDRGCISTSLSSSTAASTTSKTTSTSTKATTLTTTSKSTSTSTTIKTTTSSTTSKTTAVTTTTTSSSSSSKATTSVAGTTSSSVASASVTVPAGCSVPSDPITITSFSWFNSTHNLDCANPNFASTDQVCWSSTALCDAGNPACTCTPYCYTGLPSFAYQPRGFGPPDTIAIGLNGGSPFTGANPQSVRRFEVGQGHFDPGSGPDSIGFTGDSNKDTGNVGSVYYNAYYGTTCNGLVARYTASVPLICSHDAGNNATCTAPVPLPMTFAGYF